ncbi:MAG: hypothetical protein IMZ44_22015, partial [Planctomycetes bacterium]|nr:hypothetical protein [Planctomycetota bacterium]
RVRPIAQGVYETATLVQEAARRSPTVRTMLAALDQTDLIVYVELAPSVPNRSGCLTFLTARGGVRMLRISIDMRNIVDDQIKWLGHEMAHALEVSQAPEVRDGASLAALFARIGRRVNANGSDYESAGAEEAGRQVKAELAGR